MLPLLLAAGVLAVVLASVLVFVTIPAGEASADRARQQLDDIAQIELLLSGQANDQRGYLLTGRSLFLDEFAEREAQAEELAARLARGMSAQRRRSLESSMDAARRFGELHDKVVHLYRDGQQQEALDLAVGEGRDVRREAQRELAQDRDLTVANAASESNSIQRGARVLTGALLLLSFIPGYAAFEIGRNRRKAADAETLRDQKQRLVHAQRLARLGSWDLDLDSRTIHWTDELAAIYGLEGLRVLVVDDNETNRLILHDQLQAWGMEAELAEDGPTALKLLSEAAAAGTPFALALLDMCMSPMDGLQLAAGISGTADLAQTRLVLLTSCDDVGPDEAKAAGILVSLTKPVRQSQLYDALMRVTAPSPEVPVPSVPPAPRNGSSAVGERGLVLVVEDNDINQMVAQGILEELGYSVDIAGNGAEALNALERQAYTVVFMDCQMPEMDGFEATAAIREREVPERRTPIIAMTAGAIEGDRERCLAAGMDDYITKPVDPEEVARALSRWTADVSQFGVLDEARDR